MTRRRAELATWTTSDIDDLIKKKLSARIIKDVEKKAVGMQLVYSDAALSGQSGNQLKFKKRGKVQGDEVAEGASIPTGEPAETEVKNVTVIKVGYGSSITQEAIEDGRRDEVRALTDELTLAISRLVDEAILREVFDPTEESNGYTGDGSAVAFGAPSNLPVISAKAFVGTDRVEIASINAHTGYVTLASAPASDASVTIKTYYPGTDVGAVVSASANTLALTDVKGARLKITPNGYSPDVLVATPTYLSDIMDNDKFIHLGKGEGLINANLARLYDMNVFVTNAIPDRILLLMDTGAQPVVFLPKRPFSTDTYEDKGKQILTVYASQRFGVGCLIPKAVAYIEIKD